VPFSSNSPGRRSSGTTWSKARRLPDDPALADYWVKRRRRNNDTPPLGRVRSLLLRKQKGRCPVCDGLLAARRPATALSRGMGAVGGGNPQGDHREHGHRRGRQSGSEGTASRPRTLPTEKTLPRPPVKHRPRSPRACLSRGAGKARSPGSEGRAAQQCAALTRPSHPPRQSPATHLRRRLTHTPRTRRLRHRPVLPRHHHQMGPQQTRRPPQTLHHRSMVTTNTQPS
jgi:hypothetical protein